MSTFRERLAIAAALMLVASPSLAQSTSTTTTFQNLSPGNQNIARALFLSQQPTAGGPAPLSLNQIAALKSGDGWGQVFKEMKSEGLIEAKNLGEVVSRYEHHVHASTQHEPHTVATTGAGRPVDLDSAHGHDLAVGDGGKHGDLSADHANDAGHTTVATANGAGAGGSLGASGAHGGLSHGR
jgi:hypothetical protein